ncbi:hypothetical protein GCM10011521_26980 [Arenimonas soli]|uniref:Uncharacterized protein n=1 Tax=Arenimonas soli TaxID=2269504 RepID=A0ABQ1HSQ6_9GAMM|nr:hypothetical protein [Arenimonas soli]GGA87150.1 hypothetical protein GCM10011521_26980 [Arenimonas soli]
MKACPLFLALATALATAPALADDSFRSPDVKKALAAGRAAILAERAGLARKAAPTPEEVGDADSFGRNVKWLGLLSGYIYLLPDCSVPGEPADPRCITLNPAGAPTPFAAEDVAVVTLPGRSSHSLICHWQTPIAGVAFANYGATRAPYQFRVFPTYRIESEVLDGLSDPNTGTPYNGAIEVGVGAINVSGYLEPGDFVLEQFTQTRTCIGGIVSKRSLVNGYGLTEAQARRFFREPITIRMSLQGQATLVDSANINFGTRLTGD